MVKLFKSGEKKNELSERKVLKIKKKKKPSSTGDSMPPMDDGSSFSNMKGHESAPMGNNKDGYSMGDDEDMEKTPMKGKGNDNDDMGDAPIDDEEKGKSPMGGEDNDDMGDDMGDDMEDSPIGGDEEEGDDDMDDDMGDDMEDDTDEKESKIDSIVNKLGDDDRKAVEKYAQSLLDRKEEDDEDEEEDDEMPSKGKEQSPMMEIFKVRRGKLVKEDDGIGIGCKNNGKRKGLCQKNPKINKKSPFSAPRFSKMK